MSTSLLQFDLLDTATNFTLTLIATEFFHFCRFTILINPADVFESYLVHFICPNHTYSGNSENQLTKTRWFLPTLELLSNGNTYPERCGLEGMFRFVIFSQDYGVEKPNPRLFQIAIEKAGCSRRQFLHVGDSLQDDVMGAVNVGIKCVWLNQKQVKNNLDSKIHHEISSLLELLEIL